MREYLYRNVGKWIHLEFKKRARLAVARIWAGFNVHLSKKYKAIIMGRTTYNILAPNYLPLQDEGTTVVLTTDQQAKSDNPTVVFTQSKATEAVEMLAKRGHTEAVIIGGTTVISEFMNAGLVDDIYFVMEPALFGGGLPLLRNVETESKLKLLEVVRLNENTIQLHYGVQKQS